jgi:hypothetical protein
MKYRIGSDLLKQFAILGSMLINSTLDKRNNPD